MEYEEFFFLWDAYKYFLPKQKKVNEIFIKFREHLHTANHSI